MVGMATSSVDLTRMPRGGPDASCLDRLLDRFDDRGEVDPDAVLRVLGWTGGVFGSTRQFAEIVLAEVAEVADPRILELGGDDELSRTLRDWHPTVRLTTADVDSVAEFADGQFDLAVLVLGLHHLSPERAARVLAEGARVADKLLVIDLPRPPAPLHLLRLASMLPLAPWLPFVHDGLISSLRAYSPSALRALAADADPTIDVELHGGPCTEQIVLARRRTRLP